ncbi:MAG: aminomethyl-transferring glycine dehydrogenase subunit GcvPA [Candidatus Sericytochromatia bacterium]|nr:aminomethyl-transferring glycine dehydrogenase subunit GcvPA [Candidatus Tanganyikabacteria bacterium]
MTYAYLPHTPADRAAMLDTIGVSSMDALLDHIPKALREVRLDLPRPHAEAEIQQRLARLAARNVSTSQQASFLGAGVGHRYRPAAVDQVASRSEFYTAYTPYQPEVSQGTLQAIFEFQSMICELTGMDVANASMYDGSTAVAEAALMAVRVTGRPRVLVCGTVHPEYEAVTRTYGRGPGLRIDSLPARSDLTDVAAATAALTPDTAALIVQVPGVLGTVADLSGLADAVHAAGALLVVVADPVALGVLEAPGRWGADLVVGEAQSLGNAMSLGGPHVGFMACREAHIRQLPGRICGMSVDAEGRPCFTLTLQTREQHIRREKAASNICTNQALNALFATIHLALLGPEGLREVATTSALRAHHLAERLVALPGCRLANPDSAFLNEFVLNLPVPAAVVRDALLPMGVLAGLPLDTWWPERTHDLLIAVTEMNGPEDLEGLVSGLAAVVTTQGGQRPQEAVHA